MNNDNDKGRRQTHGIEAHAGTHSHLMQITQYELILTVEYMCSAICLAPSKPLLIWTPDSLAGASIGCRIDYNIKV